jgi:hypothetical protein
VILFRCPLCGTVLSVADALGGQTILCSVCRRCLRAPTAEAATVVAPPPVPAAVEPPVPRAPAPAPAWNAAPPPVRLAARKTSPPAVATKASLTPQRRLYARVKPAEDIPEVLPADGPGERAVRPARRPRRPRRRYVLPVYFPEEPDRTFFTFDRVLGLVLFGAGLLLLVIIIAAGAGAVAGLLSALLLIPGATRFALPDFLTGTRFAGLISLLIGVYLVVLINASNRHIGDTELAMVPFMFAYLGGVVFSTLGVIGLLKG